MKITFLCPHLHIAGGTRAILKYSDLLAGRGHEVRLIVPVADPVRRVYRRVCTSVLHEPRWQPTRAPIRHVPVLDDLYLPPSDVTLATAWKTAGPLAAADPAVTGAKAYLVQHYESLYHGDRATVDATYRLGLAPVTISHWLRDTLRKNFGTDAKVIVTPVDHEVFHDRGRPAAGDPGRPLRVCMLYHGADWKDVPTGVAAVQAVRDRGLPVELVMIGTTAPEKMRELAGEIHHGKSGAELAAVYRSCDVYLCSSRFEGLGMPGMEAMACGCGLVSTDTGGVHSYATHGVDALIAPQGDAAALADYLAKLHRDRTLLARLRDAGRDRIARLRWDDATDRLEDWLAALASTPVAA